MKYKLQTIFIITFIIIISNSCKKNNEIEVITSEISYITPTSAVSGGIISCDEKSDVTAKGVCWSTSQDPTVSDNKTDDGKGLGQFKSNIAGLTPNTKYYVRAYGTNKKGTTYGKQVEFKTYSGTVIDIDGNFYDTIHIGTQIWLKENLKVTHYRNGDPIPEVTDSATWVNLKTGAYSNYNNIENNSFIYGRLYNWYAISDTRNIAPVGWHVATHNDWTILAGYLGSNAGGKMKEAGTSHWFAPNTGATNESGFTALPGGFRDIESGFFDNSFAGFWWSPSGNTNYESWCKFLIYNTKYLNSYCVYENYGLSVRCIKD